MRRCLAAILSVSVPILLWAAWAGGVSYGIDHAPWLTIAAIGVVTASFLAFIGIAGSRFSVAHWHWDHFTAKFQREDISEAAASVSGPSIVDGQRFRLRVAVTDDGVILENSVAQYRPNAILPWASILRVVRATIIEVKRKACEPYPVAYLYLRQSQSPILIPWQDVFDSNIPEQIGFEKIGQIALR